MSLLKEAVMEQAAAKVGAFGPAGSGKTSTMTQLALGVSKQFYKSAPVAFFDTEKGSDFMKPMFDAEGVKLVRIKSRALLDLISVVKEAEQMGCCALIVDSISHVWKEVIDAYCKANRDRSGRPLKKPEFHHWKDIKAGWSVWTDTFLNSPLHIFVAGRAGWEYEYQENDETGKKDLVKGGTKMKAEGEFGYEPDMLIELYTERETDGERGAHMVHKAVVLKDRTWALNGKEFEWTDRPAYKANDYKLVFDPFAPHFKLLNIGGVHVGVGSERNSEQMFDGGSSEQGKWAQRKAVALEDIEATMTLLWPGQTSEAKRTKILVIEYLFGTRSWKAVEAKGAEPIEKASKLLRRYQELAKDQEIGDEEALTRVLNQARESLLEDSLGIEGDEMDTVLAAQQKLSDARKGVQKEPEMAQATDGIRLPF